MEPEQEIKQLLQRQEGIIVLGAGFSKFTSGLPGWGELIKDGLKFCF